MTILPIVYLAAKLTATPVPPVPPNPCSNPVKCQSYRYQTPPQRPRDLRGRR
jgi:hypothetical protein